MVAMSFTAYDCCIIWWKLTNVSNRISDSILTIEKLCSIYLSTIINGVIVNFSTLSMERTAPPKHRAPLQTTARRCIQEVIDAVKTATLFVLHITGAAQLHPITRSTLLSLNINCILYTNVISFRYTTTTFYLPKCFVVLAYFTSLPLSQTSCMIKLLVNDFERI